MFSLMWGGMAKHARTPESQPKAAVLKVQGLSLVALGGGGNFALVVKSQMIRGCPQSRGEL